MAYPDIDYWKVNNPIKLLEYLSMEKPVIVRDMVTFRSVVSAQEGAMFIDDNDPLTIADAICKAQTDANLLRVKAWKGREIVIQRYTWDQQAFKLDTFLEAKCQASNKRVGKPAPIGDSYPVSP
jgi:glycosyltransferase involved in cell wall biosynthesis